VSSFRTWWNQLGTPAQATLIAAVIAGVFSILGALIGLIQYRPDLAFISIAVLLIIGLIIIAVFFRSQLFAVLQRGVRIVFILTAGFFIGIATTSFWPQLLTYFPWHPEKPRPLITEPVISEPFHVNRLEPILDNALFVGTVFNNFVIGGRNLSLVSIDVRGSKGEELELRPDSNYEYGKYLAVPYEKWPHFEIKYRDNIYSIEVLPGSARSPYYTIRWIPHSTLQLMPTKELLSK
jgi:hypothetical protein